MLTETTKGRLVQYDAQLYSDLSGKQTLPNILPTDSTELGRSAFGVTPGGYRDSPSHLSIDKVISHHYRGGGLGIQALGSCFDCQSHHNYRGADLLSSDIEISRCRLYDNRDMNLWIKRDAGNCQSLNNHLYGSRIAFLNSGSVGGRSLQDTIADAWLGYVSYGWQEVITNSLLQHNTIRDFMLMGHTQRVSQATVIMHRSVNEEKSLNIIDPSSGVTIARNTFPYQAGVSCRVGIELGDFCSFEGGSVNFDDFMQSFFTSQDNPSEGTWIRSGCSGITLDTLMNEYQTIDGAVGVRVQGGNSTVNITLVTKGFAQTNSRMAVVNNGSTVKGLRMLLFVMDNGTVAIPGSDPVQYYPAKDLNEMITVSSGWQGNIELFDAQQGVHYTTGNQITEGQSI